MLLLEGKCFFTVIVFSPYANANLGPRHQNYQDRKTANCLCRFPPDYKRQADLDLEQRFK
jgi:hypothetical protein